MSECSEWSCRICASVSRKRVLSRRWPHGSRAMSLQRASGRRTGIPGQECSWAVRLVVECSLYRPCPPMSINQAGRHDGARVHRRFGCINQAQSPGDFSPSISKTVLPHGAGLWDGMGGGGCVGCTDALMQYRPRRQACCLNAWSLERWRGSRAHNHRRWRRLSDIV